MVDPVGVEQRGPALDAMDGVALAEQEFGQVGAILAGDTGDECGFGHGVPSGGCESDAELFEVFASPRHTRSWPDHDFPDSVRLTCYSTHGLSRLMPSSRYTFAF